MFTQQTESNPFDAINAYPGVSQSYKFFSTREIVNTLGNIGWVPSQVIKTRARSLERRPYAKHMVRLRNSKFQDATGYIPELVIVNAHDATSSLKLLAGIFRLVCSNGLIRQTQDMGADFIPHTKLTMEEVLRRVSGFGDYIDSTMQTAKKWSQYYLTPEQEYKFLTSAYITRFPNETSVAPEALETINRYRRQDDIGNTLWLTLNRVQENLLQGGFGLPSTSRRTRQVKSVDRNYQINTKLWKLAEDIYNKD